jgi:hypothetical protein
LFDGDPVLGIARALKGRCEYFAIVLVVRRTRTVAVEVDLDVMLQPGTATGVVEREEEMEALVFSSLEGCGDGMGGCGVSDPDVERKRIDMCRLSQRNLRLPLCDVPRPDILNLCP